MLLVTEEYINSARQVGLYLSQAWKLEERPS